MNLEKLIQDTNLKLEQKLDLPSPNADIKVYSPADFPENKPHYNLGDNCIYIPENVSPAILIHEYFGHGLFNNHTPIGRKQQQLVKQIFQMEQTSQPTKETLDEYLSLKKKAQKLYQQYLKVEEGFSIWIEYFMLQSLGLEDEWKKRKQSIKDTEYSHCLNEFINVLNQEGMFSTLYHMGFPKTNRQDIVESYAKEKLGDLNELDLLVMYGSGKRDIDLLAVCQKEPKTNQIYDGHIDINLLGKQEFEYKLNLYDLEIVEPLITGKFLLGQSLEQFVEHLKTKHPSNEAVIYNKRRSIESFASSEYFIDQYKNKCRKKAIWNESVENAVRKLSTDIDEEEFSKDLTHAVSCLSYTLSYNLAAQNYAKGNIITFEEMLEQDESLAEITKYLKDIEYGVSVPKIKNVLDLIKIAKEYI